MASENHERLEAERDEIRLEERQRICKLVEELQKKIVKDWLKELPGVALEEVIRTSTGWNLALTNILNKINEQHEIL